jgi:saccharopine dehydrogenase-like NADP-dependent oxidoreductase
MSRFRDIVLLGAGRVGNAIARDLVRDGEYRLTAADASLAALGRLRGVEGIRLEQVDLGDDQALRSLIAHADLVVGAVPGPLGFETLRRVLEAGKHVVDISFFEEDAFALDALAREHGCTAVVDCGIAPGCSNLILGHFAATLDSVERFWCAVGGLPVERHWPFEYRAPFSPIDVIAEYTRPARFRRSGEEVTMPALSEVELIDLPGIGTLEAFNTDGLRTLLATLPVPDMVEKTLRYPGHAERMRIFRETGFFSDRGIELDGELVRPIDVTAELLFDAWQYDEGEEDLTVMRVVVDGTHEGRPVRHRYDLLDRYDVETDTASMSRTTGYTCTAVVRLLDSALYSEPGITPPELLGGTPGCFDFIMARLEERGVRFTGSTSR